MTTVARKILHYLSIDNRPQTPLEIAQNLKLNENTVRARLSELRKKGMVFKEYAHHYVISPSYGVGSGSLPRVQNLRFTARGVAVVRSETVVRELPGVRQGGGDDLRIRITFGKKRGIISYTVKAPMGLDPYGLRLCHELVEMEAWMRGHKDLMWFAINFDFLWDYQSVRLEGVQVVTFDDLMGTLEKYYNKGSGMRREFRVTGVRGARIQDLEALIQGGITSHQALQGLNVLRGEVQHLTEALRSIHDQYRDMLEMFKASQAASLRLIDKVDALFNVSSRDRWDKARVLREDGSFDLRGMDVGLRTQQEDVK